MAPAIIGVVGDETADHAVADPKSPRRKHAVSQTEDLKPQARRPRTDEGCDQEHHTGSNMQRAVQRIDDEDAEEHFVVGEARHEAENSAGCEACAVEHAEWPKHS